MEIADQYDCIVMGGGPAGSTAAALVAQAGFRTLLVERDRMPRKHVGESLMPESYWTFERLGVLGRLEQSRFARKVGVQFVSHAGRESAPFFFRQHDDRPCSETWHVDRAEFDLMLFENAASLGADCRQGVRAREVAFEEGRAIGVWLQSASDRGGDRATDERAASRFASARVVVDATGQHCLLANRLGVRRMNAKLRKAAIWGHFRGGARDEEGGGVKTLIMHTNDRQAWFWYIPMADDVVSVGVVGDRDFLLRGRNTPQEVFYEELAKCEGAASRLHGAESIDELEVLKEFSYTTEKSAGDGWVLIGDAWGFIDPVYSSGVFFALKSAELAADALIDGLRNGDVSERTLGRWTEEFGRQTHLVRQLVHAFYSGEFRVGKFLHDYPQHQHELVDLLIGRIFNGSEGRIFADLEPWLERNG